MLLIMCQAAAKRFAIDASHVSEVLPRVALHAVTQSPPWVAGLLVHRGAATPVIDLTQLTEGEPCPDRLNSRIVVLQTDLDGTPRRFGVLAERVGLREVRGAAAGVSQEATGDTALGRILLDEQGPFHLIDIACLLSEERRAFLFPALARER